MTDIELQESDDANHEFTLFLPKSQNNRFHRMITWMTKICTKKAKILCSVFSNVYVRAYCAGFLILSFIIISFVLLIGRAIFPISSSTENDCDVLALSGGGARGSFEVGVLKNLYSTSDSFPDIVTGVSVGALNSIMLSTSSELKRSIASLKNIWFNLTTDDIYKSHLFPLLQRSVYDTAPLRKTLLTMLGQYGHTPFRPIYILATSLNDGSPIIFNRTDFSSIDRAVDILLASSSVPVLFPPIEIDGMYLVDGGLFSNTLIQPAIDFCRRTNPSRRVIITAIVCSGLEKYDTTEYLKSLKIIGLAQRAFQIGENSLFNHAVYTYGKIIDENMTIRIITPIEPLKGGLLDFDLTYIQNNYDIGLRSATNIKIL